MTDRNELERLQPMTTEQKALALVNALRALDHLEPTSLGVMSCHYSFNALCCAIEADEADKKAFSGVAERAVAHLRRTTFDAHTEMRLERDSIIVELTSAILPEPEPDPLVEIAREMTLLDGVVRTDNQKAAIREGRAGSTASDDFYDRLRMALPARGYKIERIEQ